MTKMKNKAIIDTSVSVILTKSERLVVNGIRSLIPDAGSKVFRITPNVARTLLERIWPGQRPMRRGRVIDFKRYIKGGNFLLTHQGLLFDVDGFLHDGQHRLAGCVMVGIPIDVQCSSTKDPDVYKVLDQGAKRTINDIYGVNKDVSAICRFIVGTTSSLNKPLSPIEYEWIWDTDFFNLAQDLMAFAPKSQKGLCNAAPRACAVMTAMLTGDKDYAFNFYRNMNTFDYDLLPPVGRCLMKRYVSGNLLMSQSYNNKVENTGLFMFVYDRTNQDTKRLIMPYDRSQKIYSDTRRRVKSHLLRNGYVDENWAGFVELRGHEISNKRKDNATQSFESSIYDTAPHG